MKLLRLEFFKCRRRKIVLLCAAVLAAEVRWLGMYLTRGEAGDLGEGWGMGVVVSTHRRSEIDRMADRVAIRLEGELVFQDTLRALHGRSRHHLALRTRNSDYRRDNNGYSSGGTYGCKRYYRR